MSFHVLCAVQSLPGSWPNRLNTRRRTRSAKPSVKPTWQRLADTRQTDLCFLMCVTRYIALPVTFHWYIYFMYCAQIIPQKIWDIFVFIPNICHAFLLQNTFFFQSVHDQHVYKLQNVSVSLMKWFKIKSEKNLMLLTFAKVRSQKLKLSAHHSLFPAQSYKTDAKFTKILHFVSNRFWQYSWERKADSCFFVCLDVKKYVVHNADHTSYKFEGDWWKHPLKTCLLLALVHEDPVWFCCYCSKCNEKNWWNWQWTFMRHHLCHAVRDALIVLFRNGLTQWAHLSASVYNSCEADVFTCGNCEWNLDVLLCNILCTNIWVKVPLRLTESKLHDLRTKHIPFLLVSPKLKFFFFVVVCLFGCFFFWGGGLHTAT